MKAMDFVVAGLATFTAMTLVPAAQAQSAKLKADAAAAGNTAHVDRGAKARTAKPDLLSKDTKRHIRNNAGAEELDSLLDSLDKAEAKPKQAHRTAGKAANLLQGTDLDPQASPAAKRARAFKMNLGAVPADNFGYKPTFTRAQVQKLEFEARRAVGADKPAGNKRQAPSPKL